MPALARFWLSSYLDWFPDERLELFPEKERPELRRQNSNSDYQSQHKRAANLRRSLWERNVALMAAAALTNFWILGQTVGSARIMSSSAIMPPPGTATACVIGLVAVTLFNGVFVAAETAVELLKSAQVKHFKEEKAENGVRLQCLLDEKAMFATACTLGGRLCRLIQVFLVFLLAENLAMFLADQGTWVLSYLSLISSALMVSVPVIVVNLVVGELVPKSYATLHPPRVALRLYRVIKVSAILLSLPANFIVSLAGLFTARFGGKPSFSSSNPAEDEIKILVESAQESGEIESDEKELLHSVFEFTDTVAREIMTPRVDMDAMPTKSNPEDVVALIEKSGHSRIPLYEETDDQIVGIIHAKDLLMALVSGKAPVSLRALMRPALFVPENKNLHELLADMRATRGQMAVVQDEFGGTAGIVTIEDIVEELVGDIVDEYDVEETAIVASGNGHLVDGRTHVDDVNSEIGSLFGSDEFDTIGGFVFGLFGRQPRQAEVIESNGFRFTVANTDGRRIHQLLVEAIVVQGYNDLDQAG